MIPVSEPKANPANHAAHLDMLLAAEQRRQGGIWKVLRQGFWGVLAIALLTVSAKTANVDLPQFWQRIPTVTEWLSRLFPPDFSELPSFLAAIWETLAIALIGTGCAIVAAVPLALLVARNISPVQWLATPLRGLLNLLRGIDTAIFALFFVSIVGLYQFAS